MYDAHETRNSSPSWQLVLKKKYLWGVFLKDLLWSREVRKMEGTSKHLVTHGCRNSRPLDRKGYQVKTRAWTGSNINTGMLRLRETKDRANHRTYYAYVFVYACMCKRSGLRMTIHLVFGDKVFFHWPGACSSGQAGWPVSPRVCLSLPPQH